VYYELDRLKQVWEAEDARNEHRRRRETRQLNPAFPSLALLRIFNRQAFFDVSLRTYSPMCADPLEKAAAALSKLRKRKL